MELDLLVDALSSKINPTPNPDGASKLASVLVLIYGKEPTILMTKKSEKLTRHGGEIAFPGGQWSKEYDSDLLETAIRETREEVGLDVVRNEVIGQLQNVRTLNSGFIITPFVCVKRSIPSLKSNPEVEMILHMPLVPLLKTVADDTNPKHQSIQEMYTFTYKDKIVWGASARILKQIINRLKFLDSFKNS